MSEWVRSSYCDTASCVEVMDLGEVILVRNSGSGRQVEFTRREWEAFLRGVDAGEFAMGD